jgi:hypothetical protein
MTMATSQMPAPAPANTIIATLSEAHDLASGMSKTMAALLDVLDLETSLVRIGKIREAIALEARKAELTQSYIHATSRFKANQAYLKKAAPDLLKALRGAHETFQASLQVNLTVLATAHAVSEGIVRGVNVEMQRRAAPSTYTAAGMRSAPARTTAPLAVSRSL